MPTWSKNETATRMGAALWHIGKMDGTPYRWAGNDPMAGFDCSGLAHEYLQAAGLEDHGRDSTAHDLYIEYKDFPAEPKMGALIFWFSAGRAIHVEIFVNDFQTIGASGGGRPKFDLFTEIKKDPILRNFYGHLTAEEFKRREGDLFLRIAKESLYLRQAIDQNAYVKVRPFTYRAGQTKIVDPFSKNKE